MKIRIRHANIDLSSALAEHAQTRLERGLHRISGMVRSACVRLADINGPRGGADKECQVRVTLSTGHELVVNSLDSCPYRAIDDAVNRLKRSVKKTMSRRRNFERRSLRR